MDRDAVTEAVDEVARMLRADGADLELRDANPKTARIHLVLVLGSVVLVGALSFLPALALGPIAEHLHP